MKALEGKYIDLANYYKNELSHSSNSNIMKNQSTQDILEGPSSLSQNSQSMHHNSQPSNSSSKSAVSGVISIQQRDIQAQNLHTGQLMQQNSNQILYDQAPGNIHSNSQGFTGFAQPSGQEDVIITDLRKEQKKLEQKMALFMQANSLGKSAETTLFEDTQNDKFNMNSQDQSIQQKCVMLQDSELIRFNNELQGAFKDILDQVDQSQLLTVNTMGQRQAEMFQLSAKYRLPSGFKNDAIGVWYDAKTEVVQYISKLKQFIQEKGISTLAQTFKSSQALNPSGSQDGVKCKQDYLRMIEVFEEDMVNLKRKSKDFNKTVQKLRSAIKTHDDSINQFKRYKYQDLVVCLDQARLYIEKVLQSKLKQHSSIQGQQLQNKNNIKNEFQDQQDLVANKNEQNQGRGNEQNYTDFNGMSSLEMGDLQANLNSLTINSQGSSNIQMSPFDKRVNAYSKNAFNRSNSRGMSSISTGIQKPPKLAPQNTQSNQVYHKPTVAGTQQQDWQIDQFTNIIGQIRQRVIDYQSTVGQLLQEVNEKNDKVEEISKRIDEQVNETLLKFLQTHDTDIVKQFFTNTVLTPTETAHILAKANLQAHQQNSISGAVKNYQQIVSSQSNNKRTPKQSVSPYRQSRKSASREPSNGTNSQFRKTTPSRQKNTNTGTSTSAQRIAGNVSSHGQTPSRDLGNFKQNNSIVHDSFKQNYSNNNTEHIYKELKKSNEKCMEYQVEIRKLKDQVQVYNLQLEDLRIHNNRYQNQIQNYQKQVNQFRINNTRTARVTPGNLSVQEVQSPSHRLYGEGQHQIGQAYSSTSYSQDKEEIIAEEQELCKRIDHFFQAMKLLQKSVNRKEDISELKVEFETKQRALQKLSKQIQVRINGSKMQIHQTNQDQNRVTIQDNPENQNKKVSNQSVRNRSQSTRAQQTSATRQQVPASSSHRLPSSPLRSKQNALNQQQFKNNQKTQAGPSSNLAKSPKPYRGNDPSNQFESKQQSQNNNQQNVVYDEIFIQENQVVNVVQPKPFTTSNLNLQSNKSNLNNDQSEQLQQAKKQIQELSQFLNSVTVQKNELLNLLQGHHKSLYSVQNKFNSGKINLSQQQVEYLNEIFNGLLRELDITLKHFNNRNQQSQSGEQLNIIKENLVSKISAFEQSLLSKYNELHSRLAKREEDIQSVKKLFIDKLKVLESNFSEIGDHIIANQAQQEQEKQQNQEPESHTLLKRYLTDSDLQEQDEKQLEELINTNSQLYDQINELKRQLKDYVDPASHQQVLESLKQAEDKLKKLEIENGSKLQKAFDNLQKEKASLQEELQKIKIEKSNLQQENQKSMQQQMVSKLEQEKKDMIIEQTINEIQLSLKDEIEQKICAQKEAKEKSQIARQKELLTNEKEQQLVEKEKILNIYEDEIESLKFKIQEEAQSQKKFQNIFNEELREIKLKKQEALKEKNELNEILTNYKNISEKHILELENQIQELQDEAHKQKTKLIEEIQIEKVESSKKWNILQQKIQVIEEQKAKEKDELQAEIDNKISTAQKIESEMQILKDQQQKYDDLQIQFQELEELYRGQQEIMAEQENQLEESLQKINDQQNQYEDCIAQQQLKIEEFEIQILDKTNEYNQLNSENEESIFKIEQLNSQLASQLEQQQQQELKILELQNQIKNLVQENQENSQKLQQNIDSLNIQLQELQNQNIDSQNSQNRIYELEQIIEENTIKIESYQKEINNFEEQNQLIKSDLENKISDFQIKLQESLQQQQLTENENKTLNDSINNKEKEFLIQIQTLKDQLLSVEEQLGQQNQLLLQAQLENEGLKVLNNNLEEQKNLEYQKQEQLQSENEELKNQIDTFENKQLENQSEEVSDLNKQKAELEQNIEILEAQIEKMIEDYKTQQELFEKQIEIEKQQTLQSFQDEMKIKTNSLQQQENQINQLQQQLDLVQSQLEESQNQAQSLIIQNSNHLQSLETNEQAIQSLKNELEEKENQLQIKIQNNNGHLEIIDSLKNEAQNYKEQIESLIASKAQESNTVQFEEVIQQLQDKIQKQSEEYEIRIEDMQIEIAQLKEDQKRVDELLLDLDEIQKNQDEEKIETEKLKLLCEQQLQQISILESQLDKLHKAEENKDIQLSKSQEDMLATKKLKDELEMKVVKLKLEKSIVKSELEAKLRAQSDATAELINDLEVKAKLKEEQLEQLAHSMMSGQKPALSSRSKNSIGYESEVEQERQNMIQVMQDLRLQLEKERQESQKLKDQLKDKEFQKQQSSRR